MPRHFPPAPSRICISDGRRWKSCRSSIHAFTDKIEFMNAGSLPMPAEQMVRTFYSSLRNPTIAKLFRFANISENVGLGVGKLFSWKQLTGNDVTCESDRNVVRVTFF